MNKRKRTASKELRPNVDKRWHVEIWYRANIGLQKLHFDIDEILQLDQLVEHGIHWAAIKHIKITYSDPARVGRLTLEEALLL